MTEDHTGTIAGVASGGLRPTSPPPPPKPRKVTPLPKPMKTYTGTIPGVCPSCGGKLLLQVTYHPTLDEFDGHLIPPDKMESNCFPGDPVHWVES
jgi:hypothetical protein